MNETRLRFRCRNCEQVWFLPPEIHIKTTPHHLNSPTETPQITFWCRACGILSDYSPSELPPVIPPKQESLKKRLDATILVCMLFQCGEENCEFPIAIHIVDDAGAGRDELQKAFLLRRLAKSCPVAHFASRAVWSDSHRWRFSLAVS